MLNHIDKAHPETKPADTQAKITTIFCSTNQKKWPINDERALALTRDVCGYIVEELRPLTTVESKAFRRMMRRAEPSYEVPSRKYITANFLRKSYNEEAEKLKTEVESATMVGLTHDLWTSKATQSFGTFTAQFITEEFELKCKVLQTRCLKGSHTGAAIAESFLKCKEEWHIGDVIVTTDNAGNETKALDQLGWIHFGCLGHNINLAVRKALSNRKADNLVSKGRLLVGYFHRSTAANHILTEKQKIELHRPYQGHHLIQDCQTRWNSTYEMLARLIEQMPAIKAVAYSGEIPKDLRNLLFTDDEIEFAKSLCGILKGFKSATTALSSESQVTSSSILPSYVKFNKMLEEKPGDCDVVKKMKNEAEINFAKRQNFTEEQKRVLSLATVLDPRTKAFIETNVAEELLLNNGMPSVKEEPLDTAPAMVNDELPEAPTTSTQQGEIDASSIEVKEEPDTKRIKLEPQVGEQLAWLDDVIYVSSEPAQPSNLESESKSYLHEPATSQDPLTWWRTRKDAYPRLSSMARKYLAFPASSVSSERVFSLAGNIVTKKRSLLAEENIDMLIFLNKNKTFDASDFE